MEVIREFAEHAMASSHQSLVKEAAECAEELSVTLQLDRYPKSRVSYNGRKGGDCSESRESVEEISRDAVLGDR